MDDTKYKRFVYFYFNRFDPEKIRLVIPAHVHYWKTANLRSYSGGPFGDHTGGQITFSASSLEEATDYGVFMPFLVGLISFYVFRFMNTRWPASAETSLLWLAIGIAVLFTVMAAVIFKMRGFVELTFLHILYVASFGWLMPKLIVI